MRTEHQKPRPSGRGAVTVAKYALALSALALVVGFSSPEVSEALGLKSEPQKIKPPLIAKRFDTLDETLGYAAWVIWVRYSCPKYYEADLDFSISARAIERSYDWNMTLAMLEETEKKVKEVMFTLDVMWTNKPSEEVCDIYYQTLLGMGWVRPIEKEDELDQDDWQD